MREQPVPSILVFAVFILLGAASALAEQIPVRFTQGLLHGFLVLRDQNGTAIADGEISEIAHGDQVTSHLIFHFKDGSLNEETAVFYQRGKFQLISDHLVQKGPSFPHPTEVQITKANGLVTVHTTDDQGKEKIINTRLALSPDVSNGLTLTLLTNIRPTTPKTIMSMVATTPKPRMVKLIVTPSGEEPFTVGEAKHTAVHYVIKIDLGGVAKVVAPMVGKQPPDIHVWILKSEAPVFVKMEGPLFYQGPIWTVEMASPDWPKTAASDRK